MYRIVCIAAIFFIDALFGSYTIRLRHNLRIILHTNTNAYKNTHTYTHTVNFWDVMPATGAFRETQSECLLCVCVCFFVADAEEMHGKQTHWQTDAVRRHPQCLHTHTRRLSLPPHNYIYITNVRVSFIACYTIISPLLLQNTIFCIASLRHLITKHTTHTHSHILNMSCVRSCLATKKTKMMFER